MQRRLLLMFFVAALLLAAVTPLSVCLLCTVVLPLYALLADVTQNRFQLISAAPTAQQIDLQTAHSPRPPPAS